MHRDPPLPKILVSLLDQMADGRWTLIRVPSNDGQQRLSAMHVQRLIAVPSVAYTPSFLMCPSLNACSPSLHVHTKLRKGVTLTTGEQ